MKLNTKPCHTGGQQMASLLGSRTAQAYSGVPMHD